MDSIEYNIDLSTDKNFKYVVWRGVNKRNGSCWKSIFHSNSKNECRKYIRKKMLKDLKTKNSLTEKINEIAKRKKFFKEKYNKRMKYVKGYKGDLYE